MGQAVHKSIGEAPMTALLLTTTYSFIRPSAALVLIKSSAFATDCSYCLINLRSRLFCGERDRQRQYVMASGVDFPWETWSLRLTVYGPSKHEAAALIIFNNGKARVSSHYERPFSRFSGWFVIQNGEVQVETLTSRISSPGLKPMVATSYEEMTRFGLRR